MLNFKTLPYEARGQERLRAAIISLERHLEVWLRRLETPTERMVICHPDVCIWFFRKFSVGYRRYIKIGAKRGISLLRLGWVVLSLRF